MWMDRGGYISERGNRNGTSIYHRGKLPKRFMTVCLKLSKISIKADLLSLILKKLPIVLNVIDKSKSFEEHLFAHFESHLHLESCIFEQ